MQTEPEIKSGHVPRRRGRPFRSHEGPELTRRNVLDAALELTRSEELSALTIQRVAKVLDVSRTPVYTHFANADELRRALLDMVLEVEFSTVGHPASAWEDHIRARAGQLFDLLDTYPGVASELFRTGFPDSEVGQRAAAEFVGVLRGAGFAPADIPSLILAIVAIAAGSVLQIHGARNREDSQTAEERSASDRRRGTTLPPEPLSKRHFDRALDVLIAGMRAEASLAGD